MAKISDSLYELICDTAENFDGVSLYPDYSGRGMYGKECFGLSGNAGAIDNFLFEVRDNCDKKQAKELREMIKDKNQDQLGLGVIIYFPHFEIPEQNNAPKPS